MDTVTEYKPAKKENKKTVGSKVKGFIFRIVLLVFIIASALGIGFMAGMDYHNYLLTSYQNDVAE